MALKDGFMEVQLFTRQPRYAIPDTPLLVPVKITCNGLTDILNDMLKETSNDESNYEQVKFDYIIEDELMRGELHNIIKIRNIDTEHTLKIEYVEASPPPKPENCLVHDDWVSALDVNDGWILSGCYDNTIHLWDLNTEEQGDDSAKHVQIFKAHTGPVKDVAWIKRDNKQAIFMSVSQDQTAILWNYNFETGIVKKRLFYGHSRCVQSVAITKDVQKFVTGGWDTVVKVWALEPIMKELSEEGPQIKRKKTKLTDSNTLTMESDLDKDENSESLIRVPLVTIKAHTESVSSVQWMEELHVISSSWDHTVKVWDVEVQHTIFELTQNKPIFSSDYSHLNQLLVSGGPDRHIKLHDMRLDANNKEVRKFTSHFGWVPNVKWSTLHPFQFISGGYDHLVKLWDVRGHDTPLYDMEGHEENVLCLNWSDPEYIVSGGADNSVRVYSSRQTLESKKRNPTYFEICKVLG